MSSDIDQIIKNGSVMNENTHNYGYRREFREPRKSTPEGATRDRGKVPIIMVSEPGQNHSRVISTLPALKNHNNNNNNSVNNNNKILRYKPIGNNVNYKSLGTARKLKALRQVSLSGSNEIQAISHTSETRSINSLPGRLTLPRLSQSSAALTTPSFSDSQNNSSNVESNISKRPSTSPSNTSNFVKDPYLSPVVPSAPPATPTSFNEWPSKAIAEKQMENHSSTDMNSSKPVSLKKKLLGTTSLGVRSNGGSHTRGSGDNRRGSKPHMHRRSCCTNCMEKLSSAPPESLILLPLHIALLVLLGGYLAVGACLIIWVSNVNNS